MNDQTVIVHLSDIHFREGVSDGNFDLDADIRNELLRDAAGLQKSFHAVHAILVTGDIALAGKSEEYRTATQWLRQLCETLKCREEHVWTVPGNHDVDRSKVTPIVKTLHDKIRGAPPDRIDEEIRAHLLEDESGAELMFRPLEAYRSFASLYGCYIGPEKKQHQAEQTDVVRLYWKSDLELNDGSTLRLVGLNSALVSNIHDDDGANKLVVGGAQLDLSREDGVEYVTLCHHPPQWLRDQNEVETKLAARVRLQLYGHKHIQKIDEINQRTVRLGAGALHPERGTAEQWTPTYNIVCAHVQTEEARRDLMLQIYPRVWDHSEHAFRSHFTPRGEDHEEFRLQLDEWSASDEITGEDNLVTAQCSSVASYVAFEDEKGGAMNPFRRLTYRFLSLPYTKQISVATELELVNEDDAGIKDAELFHRFFSRAKERNHLARLWESVESAHGNHSSDPNPFAQAVAE